MIDIVATRARIRDGTLRGEALGKLLDSAPDTERDTGVESLLGIEDYDRAAPPPGDAMIPYIPSGVDAICELVAAVPMHDADVFVDLGAGLGKVVMLVHLLTGVRACGIEIDAALVERANRASASIDLRDVGFTRGDARTASLADGTIFFLYLPFTGDVLATVLDRLRSRARERPIVVCTLGLDLRTKWLVPRVSESFWLTIYDSIIDDERGAGPSRLL
jgi:hypothetical protein